MALRLNYVMDRVERSKDYLQSIIGYYNLDAKNVKNDSSIIYNGGLHCSDEEILFLEKYLIREGKYFHTFEDGLHRIELKEEALQAGRKNIEYCYDRQIDNFSDEIENETYDSGICKRRHR